MEAVPERADGRIGREPDVERQRRQQEGDDGAPGLLQIPSSCDARVALARRHLDGCRSPVMGSQAASLPQAASMCMTSAAPVELLGGGHLLDHLVDAECPAGKALLNTCVNTSFGLPLMTWIGMLEDSISRRHWSWRSSRSSRRLRARHLGGVALDAGLHEHVLEPAVAHLRRRPTSSRTGRQRPCVLGRGIDDVAAADGDGPALVAGALVTAGNCMMPSGKSVGWPPLSTGLKAREVYQLPFRNISAPGLVWK